MLEGLIGGVVALALASTAIVALGRAIAGRSRPGELALAAGALAGLVAVAGSPTVAIATAAVAAALAVHALVRASATAAPAARAENPETQLERPASDERAKDERSLAASARPERAARSSLAVTLAVAVALALGCAWAVLHDAARLSDRGPTDDRAATLRSLVGADGGIASTSVELFDRTSVAVVALGLVLVVASVGAAAQGVRAERESRP